MLLKCLVVCLLHFVEATANYQYVKDIPMRVRYKNNETLIANLELKQVPYKGMLRQLYLCDGSTCKEQLVNWTDNDEVQMQAVLDESWHNRTLEVRLFKRDNTACDRYLTQKFIVFEMLDVKDAPDYLIRNVSMDWGGKCANIASTQKSIGIFYNVGSTLKIDLHISNIPNQGACSLYIKKGTELVSKSIAHGHNTQTIELTFNLTEDDHNAILEVYSRGNQDCNKVNKPLFRLMKTTDKPSTRCFTSACTIGLDWNTWKTGLTMTPKIPEVANRGRAFPGTRPRPLVSPDHLNNTRFAVFTCTAQGRPYDVLAWYQIKGNEVTLLIENTTVTQNNRVSELYVSLNKTLQESDKGSYIICVSGALSDGVFSDNITLTFDNEGASSSHIDQSSTYYVKIFTLTASVVALTVLGVVLWRRRKHMSVQPAEQAMEENNIYYATTGVTYAILDLETPESNTGPVVKELPPYTEVIGAYRARD